MSTDVVSIDAGDDIRQAYKLFASHPFRRLPVVDGDEFVGMLTVDDLLVYLTCSLEALAGGSASRPLRLDPVDDGSPGAVATVPAGTA